jgi:hypothetical protein
VLLTECWILPNSFVEILPQGDSMRRWEIWEVMKSWGFWDQSSYKRGVREFVCLLYHVRTTARRHCCEPESKLFPDTKSAGTLTLDFQPPDCEKFLLFISHQVCGGLVIAFFVH